MSLAVTPEEIDEHDIICHKTMGTVSRKRCLGNSCMAWCWVAKTEFDDVIGMERSTDEKSTHGYCSLTSVKD